MGWQERLSGDPDSEERIRYEIPGCGSDTHDVKTYEVFVGEMTYEVMTKLLSTANDAPIGAHASGCVLLNAWNTGEYGKSRWTKATFQVREIPWNRFLGLNGTWMDLFDKRGEPLIKSADFSVIPDAPELIESPRQGRPSRTSEAPAPRRARE